MHLAIGLLAIGYRDLAIGYWDRAIGYCRRAIGYWLVGLVGVLAAAAPAAAQEDVLDRGARVRSLAGGWGSAWKFGIPGYGKTTTDARFVAFHPSLGWFVIDRGEVFGEAALFVYYRPVTTVAAGPIAIGGRYHLRDTGAVLPYVSGGAGLIFTTLDIVELDRTFNFQLFYGGGVRWRPGGGNPTWRLEFRNHHISNAGTAGENLGLNALMVIGGIEWILGR